MIAALSAFLKAYPRLERVTLLLIAPFMPRLTLVLNQLRAPVYSAWFARWQTTEPENDADILAALGDYSPSFLIVVGAGALGKATLASLQKQVAIDCHAVEARDAAALLKRFTGGFVMILEEGEILERHALACFAIAARRQPKARVLYADEDMRDTSGALCAPWFKGTFDPLRLLQQASLGSAIAFDATLVHDHGLLNLRGHSLTLAATRVAGIDSVYHIPAVLLHRAPNSSMQPWRSATDRKAVSAVLSKEIPGARIAACSDRPLRIIWPLPSPFPRVSLIIPTRDMATLLGACLEGLLRHTDYPSMEVIVVDNGSTEPALHQLLRRWSSDPRLRVLQSPGEFNYASQNNQAAAIARGEVLVLLNNDTEVLHTGWLKEMVALAIRADIGAVGAKLFFPSRRIQHAGIILGPRAVATHDYFFSKAQEQGQQDDLLLLRQVSAVTGACLAVRKYAYRAVGGLDERHFPVAFNDVDFCLKLAAVGLRNIITPHARLIHHESASRRSDYSRKRYNLWKAERNALREKWGAALNDDLFYPPLLSVAPPVRIPAEPPRRMLF
jgi:GT2 family glycosyltransferase